MEEGFIAYKVWSQVKRLIRGQAGKIAAIAYVSKGAPLSFGEGDTLVCDATDQAIKAGQTDAQTLKGFFRDGAKLFSCQDLHAKVMVSGDITVVGSANLSSSAETTLVEALLVTKRPRLRSQALALINNIRTNSVTIDEKFIDHICSLPVARRPRPGAIRRRLKLEDPGKRLWVVSVSRVGVLGEEEKRLVDEGERDARDVVGDPEAEIDWVRFTGKSRFRQQALRGDSVIEIFRHKRNTVVTGPRGIVVKQDQDAWTRFYLAGEAASISWTKFERELNRLDLKGKVRKGSVRELAAREAALMETIFG
jgi:hypothetical protein